MFPVWAGKLVLCGFNHCWYLWSHSMAIKLTGWKNSCFVVFFLFFIKQIFFLSYTVAHGLKPIKCRNYRDTTGKNRAQNLKKDNSCFLIQRQKRSTEVDFLLHSWPCWTVSDLICHGAGFAEDMDILSSNVELSFKYFFSYSSY